MARKALSKKLRFDVFKRDKFTCQYCGSKAPDVVLQVDHIHPVAQGGKNDVLNLITSCRGCNGGKGARTVSDDSAVSRQRDQLAALQERRQQIEMMVRWREELTAQDDALVEAAAGRWSSVMTGWRWNEIGRSMVRAFIKKHGFEAVMDAIDVVHQRYPAAAVEKPDDATVIGAFKHLASVVKYGTDKDGQQMAYVIGILRNRCDGPPKVFHADLRAWHQQGVSVDYMTQVAKEAYSWGWFITQMTRATNG